MICTHKEAIKKWCPLTRVVFEHHDPAKPGEATGRFFSHVANRISLARTRTRAVNPKETATLTGSNCIADECMFWRPLTSESGACGLIHGSAIINPEP